MQLNFSDRTNSAQLNQINQKTDSIAKAPSKLGILILFFITITLYGFGISTLNNTVINLVEAAIEKTIIDY